MRSIPRRRTGPRRPSRRRRQALPDRQPSPEYEMPQGIRHMVVVQQLIGHRWMAVGLVAISVGLVTVWLGRRCRDLAKVLVGHLFLGVGYLEEALPGTIHLSVGQRVAHADEDGGEE